MHDVTSDQRQDSLRDLVAAAGILQASDDPGAVRIGRVLGCWAGTGGDLVAALDLRPKPGSTMDVGRLARQKEADELVTRLVQATGSVARAERVLAKHRRGIWGPWHFTAERIAELGAGTSRAAIHRAIKRCASSAAGESMPRRSVQAESILDRPE